MSGETCYAQAPASPWQTSGLSTACLGHGHMQEPSIPGRHGMHLVLWGLARERDEPNAPRTKGKERRGCADHRRFGFSGSPTCKAEASHKRRRSICSASRHVVSAEKRSMSLRGRDASCPTSERLSPHWMPPAFISRIHCNLEGIKVITGIESRLAHGSWAGLHIRDTQ